ncbi:MULTISPECIES: formate dehydrogenase subunit delta [unclassified Marinobacter]|uniref:formate dehydrogenase subunit delta n=1 Tax=unclassified Marinobacter TaxID=83889 RepID=UPI0026E29E16|nr:MULTISPECIES: formate dehydrogenase subunit delta [unclassified Marinobacter]MDO6441903.1 formate dehydrogenase subunit delta [Marinobacter sp. 2_MG-2023]MDO6824712.1 formate dehydrogenase subunit delta [Marinobacter sp. 1_MG-2023]
MSDQQLDNLIKMLDQIIANNRHCGNDEKVTDVAADHLRKFWARSMKQKIIAYANQSPAELSAPARSTIAKLEASS